MNMRILVTGGFGFIGSSFIKYLNDKGIKDIDICEPKGEYESKWSNTIDLIYNRIFHTEVLSDLCFNHYDAIIHLGANSSTSQGASSENWSNNIEYSNELVKKIANYVVKPILIFASSAATYGNETSDFSERLSVRPTNFYGFTKLETEKYIDKIECNSNIYRLRFFNVYGARESHKEDWGMSSPIYKWLASSSHTIELFESLNPLFPTGKMARDFIHVDDVCSVMYHCITHSGRNWDGDIYNVGSGTASTWEQVAETIFKAKNIARGLMVYKKMPESSARHYQYYTCANLSKLRNTLGYKKEFLSLEEGVKLTYKQMKDLL